MAKLTKLTLRGYKSIKDATIEFGAMNVLIGANGAGKSALVSFFRLLNEMMGERLQQFISTQSSTFLDYFQPEDIIVVDRTKDGSIFTRPDRAKLDAWLDEYSLGEVWEKNIVAGGPH